MGLGPLFPPERNDFVADFLAVARTKSLICPSNPREILAGLLLGAWAGHFLLFFGLVAGVGSSALVAVTAWKPKP